VYISGWESVFCPAIPIPSRAVQNDTGAGVNPALAPQLICAFPRYATWIEKRAILIIITLMCHFLINMCYRKIYRLSLAITSRWREIRNR
jgi:hypothetical protein